MARKALDARSILATMIRHSEFVKLVDVYPEVGSLEPWLQRALLHEGTRVNAHAGQVLFEVGSPCRSFLLLTSGSVRVIRPAAVAREMLLYRLGPGDICILTISCLLGEANYPARAVVETNLAAVSLSGELFELLVTHHKPFRQSVFHSLAERLTVLVDLIETVAWRQLDSRLAALLLAKDVDFQTTHEMLANEVGSVREVISRILEDFEAKGLLKLTRGRIQILDKAGLRKIAEPLGDSRH
jgi:CRP/FNR family transcriptional regulator